MDPDLLAARLADVPGRARQGIPDAGRKEAKPQHRLSLSADDAHREALVLVSIVTEGEGDEDDFRSTNGTPPRAKGPPPTRWANTAPVANREEMRRRCLEKVEAAAGLGFEELRRRHVRDVEALFDRVEFSLGPSSEGDEEPTQEDGAGLGVTPRPSSSSSSCVVGLPIRTRVSRSGKACTEWGEESDVSDSREGLSTSEETDGTVVDDGLIELMYHYGR